MKHASDLAGISTLTLLASLIAPLSAHAQDDPQLERVVVEADKRQTIKQRELGTSTVVNVITGEALSNSGSIDLNSALEKLVPSFRWPQTANSGNAISDIKSVSIRGLGPEYTLVLINGKRRHVTARLSGSPGFQAAQFVDINQVPISAIERIEVLRDGTSTLYGGDAVAGAINIILKEQTAGNQVSSRIGKTSRGDGLSKSVNGSAATAFGQDGFIRASFDWLDKEAIDRSSANPNQLIDGKPQNLKRDEWGDGRIDNAHLLLNGETALGADLRGYFVGSYGRTTGEASSRPVRYWSNTNDVNRYPDGHQPWTRAKTEDASLTAGLKWGNEHSGFFDLSLGYGFDRIKDYTYDTVAVSYGDESQSTFHRGTYTQEEKQLGLDWEKHLQLGLLAQPLQVNAGVSYRQEKWWNGLGDEQSWSLGPITTVIDPRTGAVSAAPWGNAEQKGLMPEDIVSLSRHVSGVYLGLQNRLSDQLDVSAVARHERYSDAGSSTTFQLASRYQLTPQVAVRAAAGTGFKAPALAQVGSTSASIDAATGNYTRRLRPDDPRAIALGADELEASRSHSLSLGLVLEPHERWSISVDAYQVKIKDQVVASSALSGGNVEGIFLAAGDTTTKAASFYLNGVDSTNRGLDIVTRFTPRLPDAAGRLDLSLAANFIDNQVDRYTQTRSGLANQALIGESVIANIEKALPRNKLVLSADYSLGRWEVNGNLLRYGKTEFYRAPSSSLPAPLNIRTYDPAWILNAQLSYRLSPQLKLSLGGNNLFDKMPEKTYLPNSGLDQYSHFPAYGTAGAFYYASASYDF